jgi:REP element-mobilizing transposase RayT
MSNHIHLIVSADRYISGQDFGIANPEQQHDKKKGSGLQILNNDIINPEQQKNENSISDIFRDMKKYTSKRIRECMNSLEVNESRREWINERLDRAGAFWQEGIHPIVLETAEFTRQKLDYIHMNPVVA